MDKDLLLLEKRINRCIATILSYKDSQCDAFLPENVSSELRRIILDEINSVCDLAFRLKVQHEGEQYNDLYTDKLEELNGRRQ